MRGHRYLRGSLFAVFAVVAATVAPAISARPALAAPVSYPSGVSLTPHLTVGDVSIKEGDSGKINVRVPVDLDMPAPAAFVVTFTVTGGSAIPGVDFVTTRTGVRVGQIPFRAGRTDAFVRVTLLGDTASDGDKTVNVDVNAPGVAVTKSRGTVTVLDDDLPAGGQLASSLRTTRVAALASTTPRLSIGTPTLSEGNAGVRHAAVPVTLSDPAPAPITVTFDLPGTADTTSGINECNTGFSRNVTVPHITKTITFALGRQSADVAVPVRGNLSMGASRNLVDTVSVVSGTVTLPDPTSDVVVLDDDVAGDVPPPAPGTYRVSESSPGVAPTFPPSNNPSFGCDLPGSGSASVSANGRYVVFSSSANNLVPSDTNALKDTFVKDTWTGLIQRVSVSASGEQADSWSRPQSISADGRYVTFFSVADNLVPNDDNQWWDSFLYDRATGDIRRIGVGTYYAYVAPDGSSVAFQNDAPLTGGCTCAAVFLQDIATNAISLVSTGPDGQLADAGQPAISGDGRHVAFASDVNGVSEVFVKDLDTGNLEMVSVNDAGDPGASRPGGGGGSPALSDDGRYVAYVGDFCNLSPLAPPPCEHAPTGQVYVRDRLTGHTTFETIGPSGQPTSWYVTSAVSISGDGRYVLFGTSDMSFAPECPQGGPQAGGGHVYRRDLTTGATIRVDNGIPGYPCPSSDGFAQEAMSADGNYVVYSSLPFDPVSLSNPEAVFITRLQ